MLRTERHFAWGLGRSNARSGGSRDTLALLQSVRRSSRRAPARPPALSGRTRLLAACGTSTRRRASGTDTKPAVERPVQRTVLKHTTSDASVALRLRRTGGRLGPDVNAHLSSQQGGQRRGLNHSRAGRCAGSLARQISIPRGKSQPSPVRGPCTRVGLWVDRQFTCALAPH